MHNKILKFGLGAICISLISMNAFGEPTHDKKSGYFFAYNDTDKMVVLTVGNYFPTTYTIDPHAYRMVWVSTDNQNIHIRDVFP